MKTARVSFLLQIDDDYGARPVLVTYRDSAFAVNLAPRVGCLVLGEPKLEIDIQHRCGISSQQLYEATRAMRNGGEFAACLGQALQVADSRNCERLVDAFHDLIWSFVPK